MICSKCGAENPDDSLFCNKCGNKMKEVTDKPILKRNNIWTKRKIIPIIIICVVIVAGGLFYHFCCIDTSYPFNLSTSEINNAIDFGKKVQSAAYSTSAEEMQKTSKEYLKNEMVYKNESDNGNITNVILIDPYNMIVTNASKNSSDYSLSNANEDIKSMVNDESFQLYITTSDGNITNVNLKQGNTIIKPFNTDMIDDNIALVKFSNIKDKKKINYKAKADLIIDGSKISTINFKDFIKK